ncbi:MAG: histidinol-phosphatase HisJ [Candidatus Delongbacteria bacterium]|jgi:histidinol-phosphatase (PHP family)|nr:histidinol-phosphatase HisJ [Candidatus Delongbacteria bacterium]
MILTNYHMHSSFSDGKAFPEEYVLLAIEKGFSSIGFSEHGPTQFAKHWELPADKVDEYYAEMNRLKEKYKDKIEIYIGLELDYFTGIEENAFSKYDLDYVIGSIHYFPDEKGNIFRIDCKPEDFHRTIHDYFKGDVKAFVKEYCDRIIAMVDKFKPDIIGHFDLIKINNHNEKYFSESDPWYRKEIMRVLRFIADKGTMLDVNTGGITRGFMTVPYPSPWALKEAAKLNIPVVLNSDAHRPEHIDGQFENVSKILKECGYTEKMILKDRRWIPVPI